jgi:hypothetical protein
LFDFLKRAPVGMQHSKGSAAPPTTVAETIIYTKKFLERATIVVGTLGFLPALHTNGCPMMMQRLYA